MSSATVKALLVLKDSVFEGVSVGAEGLAVGEVVFNTAMTGYQEILTDPSYAQQIVTLTYPHIGNTGANVEDNESNAVQAAGLVIRDLPLLSSNFRSEQSLSDYLVENGTVAIAEIDTRRLTRILRDQGAQSGAIVTYQQSDDRQTALEQAQQAIADYPGLQGVDLAKQVSTRSQYEWRQGTWQLDNGLPVDRHDLPYHVVAYDFGIKHNILRMLVDCGCRLTVVPAQTSATEVMALQPDGVFLSNGPGDPEPCDYAIEATREFIQHKIPVFGICLGHQLLALAAGAKTTKMKFGHHGANHPVQDVITKEVMITSQNHGFAVDESTLSDHVRTTHRSLFDNTLQGIELTNAPAFSFQGHPEASPGPHDVSPLFEHFIELMASRKN